MHDISILLRKKHFIRRRKVCQGCLWWMLNFIVETLSVTFWSNEPKEQIKARLRQLPPCMDLSMDFNINRKAA